MAVLVSLRKVFVTRLKLKERLTLTLEELRERETLRVILRRMVCLKVRTKRVKVLRTVRD
jgi:hypothetical protein